MLKSVNKEIEYVAIFEFEGKFYATEREALVACIKKVLGGNEGITQQIVVSVGELSPLMARLDELDSASLSKNGLRVSLPSSAFKVVTA